MTKGLKLVCATAALAAFAGLSLEGCGSDSSNNTPAAAGSGATAGSTGGGGNGGSTAGSAGKAGGGAGGAAAGNGGSAGKAGGGGSGGSTAGSGGQAGEAGATSEALGGPFSAAECAAVSYPTSTATCDDLCQTWVDTCQGMTADGGIPSADATKYADKAACMADCATFNVNMLCCRDEHVHNAANIGIDPHCKHAVGDGFCP